MEETASEPCPYCGYHHQNHQTQGFALRPGTILYGKYLLGRVLGQGGFGITYIGWDLALSRKVAIKEYFPSTHVSRDAATSTVLQWYQTAAAQDARDAGQEMFLKEARKLSKVTSIPQVVHIQDMFRDNNTAYITMDYIQGETLAKRIKEAGPMSWPHVKAFLLPVAASMQKVHDAGLIHRDLSPDNLMIQPDGQIRILDLGAAKDLSLHSGASSMQVAKGGFSPVEQYVMRGNSGPWTDVYSLAATAYYALTGVIPPSAVDRMEKDTLRWDLPQLRKVPASVLSVLKKCMSMRVEDRIQSMRLFADSISKSGSGSKGWKIFVPIAAAMVVVALIAALSGGSPSDTPAAESHSNQSDTIVQQEEPLQDANEIWADNILMSTTIPEAYQYDADMAPVFNSRIARYQIVSVTFLDTLDDAAADAWDVSQARDGSVMAWTAPKDLVSHWVDGQYIQSESYELFIAAENGINGKYCANLFKGFQNAKRIRFNDCFHTDYAESMNDMFYNCASLESLDISSLKTDHVRNMAGMFYRCPVEELDVGHFNTSKVTDMSGMFESCTKLKTLDLSNFDTAKVTDMSNMFTLASVLTSLDISKFNTSSVTDMSFMFSHTGLTDLDLSHFDTSNVTTISYMFSGSNALRTLDVSGFRTSKIKRMQGTFEGCTRLESVLGLTSWDTSNVEYYEDFMDKDFKINGQPWITLFE